MSAAVTQEPPTLISRPTLGEAQRAEMFGLLARHFEGITRPQFEHDLAEKDWVIEVRQAGRLVGFTSLRVTRSQFCGDAITVLYSGDTIVAPEAWGSPALARAWIAGVNAIRAVAQRRCFWLLLTSGFRTYRFLPVFWREFYPRFDRATPPDMAQLLAHLASGGYGRSFNPSSGIVRFPHPQRLRGPLAGVPDGRENNPHVNFFLRRNPGHGDGDELACLTEICDSNLTPAGRRMINAPLR